MWWQDTEQTGLWLSHKINWAFKPVRKIGYQDSFEPLPNSELNEVILADMLRRTSRFAEAENIVHEAFQSASSKAAFNMLEQELDLISIRNTAAQPVKNSRLNDLVVVQGDLTLNRPQSDLPVDLSGWRGALGLILLMSVIMPPAMVFYVAAFYFWPVCSTWVKHWNCRVFGCGQLQ